MVYIHSRAKICHIFTLESNNSKPFMPQCDSQRWTFPYLLAFFSLALSASRTACLILENVRSHIQSLPALKFNQKIYYGHNRKNDCMIPVLLSSILESIDRLLLPSASTDVDDVNLLRGLLFLRNGHIDDAHDIIQNLPSSPAAAYAHSLIHRYEAQHVGDNGLSGFSNSGYWLDDIGDFVTYKDLLIYITNETKPSLCSGVEQFAASCSESFQWRATKFLNLCILSLKNKNQDEIDFCESVTLYELHCLILHVTDKLIRSSSSTVSK